MLFSSYSYIQRLTPFFELEGTPVQSLTGEWIVLVEHEHKRI